MIIMGYKTEIKYRVIDLLSEKWSKISKRTHPYFTITDSTLDEHFGIIIPEYDIGYFARKCGQYGMTFQKALSIHVGPHPKSWIDGKKIPKTATVINVHVVTEKDEVNQIKNKK
jgi:hypothetical protein